MADACSTHSRPSPPQGKALSPLAALAPLVATAVLVALAAGCSSTPRSVQSSRDGELLSIPSDPEVERVARAHAAFAQGVLQELRREGDKALQSYTDSVLHDPGNDDLVIEVAQRHLQQKNAKKAIEILRKAIAIPDPPPVLHVLLATAYLEDQQPKAAIQEGKRAVLTAPDNPLAHRGLALAHLRDKQPALGLKVLESAARRPATNQDYLIGIAEIGVALQGVEGPHREKSRTLTLELLERCEVEKPEANPLAIQRAAVLYEASREFKKAEALYLELLKRFPSVTALKSRLLGLYLKTGDRARAIEQLEALGRASPTNPNVQYLLGGLYAEDKKPDQAVEAYQRALRLKPDMEEAYFDLSSVLLSKNRFDEAVELLRSAREKLKNRFAVEFYLALARFRQKQYDEALKHLIEAEVVAKGDDPARLNHLFYFQLGAVHERRKDFASAETALRKSIELAPKFAEALNYLGYMWADRGENLKEARGLIERALLEEPKNGAFLDSMAWVLFRLNKPQEAMAWMQKALANIEEPDPTLYDHLGDIHQALKEPAKAREAWKKSLELEANEDVRRKLNETPNAP
ncbi:MAG: tetratricopeptide repeat protein [Verrucomicrobia bacterium]|nr:tetratricopeptide repeat protein [Verrucomicrobiota bacterium]